MKKRKKNSLKGITIAILREKQVSHLCSPLLLGRKQIWRFVLGKYCSGEVVNDREYEVADENATSTLNTALLQHD